MNVPSRRHPSSAYWIWPRLWGSETRSSLRAGVHETGRSRWRAAAATAEYSAQIPALPPNAAADLRAIDADAGGVDAERGGELAAQRVGHLGRGVERQPAVVAGDGGAAVRLHRHDGHALVDVAAAHDDVADRLEVERRRRR